MYIHVPKKITNMVMSSEIESDLNLNPDYRGEK